MSQCEWNGVSKRGVEDEVRKLRVELKMIESDLSLKRIWKPSVVEKDLRELRQEVVRGKRAGRG